MIHPTCRACRRAILRAACAFVLLACPVGPSRADEDLASSRSTAYRQVQSAVAPSVVRIETTGGVERVDGVITGVGPTTGVIVRDDGYIVTSAFAFANKPAGILVTLPGGQRQPAKLVGTDFNKMITLLKTEASGLVPTKASPKAEIKVGQTAVALGKAWSESETSLNVGIVSALGRVWGKAIQTDAKTSPLNYGGPLVDLQGRVLGIIVPMDPNGTSPTAGYQWYDAGIGFAVPMEEIESALPKLMQGDLFSGLAGVGLKPGDPFAAEPVIEYVAWRSPARLAGFQKGDVIISADGKLIERRAALMHQLGNKYAGDRITLGVRRGEERIEKQLVLVGELPKFAWPMMGALVAPSEKGLVVKEILEGLPAAKKEIKAGDVIVASQGKPIKTLADLRTLTDEMAPGETLNLTLRSGDQQRDVSLALVDRPKTVPALASASNPPAEEEPAQVETHQTEKNSVPYWTLTPLGYKKDVPHGLIFCIEGNQSPKQSLVVDRWRSSCESRQLILAGYKSSNANRWLPADTEKVVEILDELAGKFTLDPDRVVIHGAGGSVELARQFAMEKRDRVRGLILSGTPIVALGPTDPSERLSLALYYSEKNPRKGEIEARVKGLRDRGYWVIGDPLKQTVGAYLNAEAVEEIARWTVLLGAL